jgi:hypothetical protein
LRLLCTLWLLLLLLLRRRRQQRPLRWLLLAPKLVMAQPLLARGLLPFKDTLPFCQHLRRPLV